MSWSICIIGKPENIEQGLQAESEKLKDQSKIEFDEAAVHIAGIVKQNYGNANQLLKVTASGHGYAVNGEQKQRHCLLNIESIYGTIV